MQNSRQQKPAEMKVDMKKYIRRVVIAIILLLVAGGVGFLAAKKIFEDRTVIETVEKEVFIEKEVEITSDIIEEELKDIGELATEEYDYTGVETYDESKSFNGFEIPFTQSKFIYSYDGTIKAGIDFNDIHVEKDDLKKLVTISLPGAQILSSEIDEKSFQLYDEKNSIFNPISVSDVNETVVRLKESAEQKAIDKGLLERADKNAQTLIKGFVKSTFGLNGYTIKVEIAEAL